MNGENLTVASVKDGEALPITQDIGQVFGVEEQPAQSGMSLYDLLFILFRHKRKIIAFTLVGLLAAGAVYLIVPSVYESQAKLLVRYVMDRGAVDGLDPLVKTPTPGNQTLINSEVEILTSADLVRQVAESVGINRLLPDEGGEPATENAVRYIYQNLDVSVVKDTDIISVAFRSSDPNIPTPVLQGLINRYFDKHLEVHRSTGAFDFVAQATLNLKKQLDQTEGELKRLKQSVGIVSLAEAKTSLATELGKTQEELDTAEADLAAQQARVKDLGKSLALPEVQPNQTPAQPVSGDILEKYKSLVARLTQLQNAENELLLKYRPENPMVKVKSDQIADLEKQRSDLEQAHPALLNTAAAAAVTGASAEPNIVAERAILVGLESRVGALKARMVSLQARVNTISEVAPRIGELERKAEVEETNYKHSEASLANARIDETLDPSRMPNISIVQSPSPASKVKRNLGRPVLGIAGGGLAVGVAVALLIELILDRTVKRSLELEKRLRIPLLLSIPYLNPSSHRLRLRDVMDNSEPADGKVRRKAWITDSRGELLRPFCEAIRDRLTAFFEINKMAYKPKLVAVTSLGKSAGASTLAAGLVAALSEDSASKVLLVDKILSSKRFYDALAEFKRSDLDYVIFDMPSIGDTSSTVPLAGFMDTVLLVVEAEKSGLHAVQRAYAELASRTQVSVVFNKCRSYGPRWLEGEI
jgi:uncharacterized protein involved in exopolysaccharide biosynthesis